MSKLLDELLFTVRQHPAFQELLTTVGQPEIKPFQPSGRPDEQYANHIYRSGARRQHDMWRQFLIGDETSQQERP